MTLPYKTIYLIIEGFLSIDDVLDVVDRVDLANQQ